MQIEPSHLGFEYARFAKRALHVISELPYALQAIGTEDTSLRNTALAKLVLDAIADDAKKAALGGIDAM